MPKGIFTDPHCYGSDKPIKVRAIRRMNYKGETKMPKEIFEVPDWQVKWWMTFPDSGIEIVGGQKLSPPPKPEDENVPSPTEETGKSRTKAKFRTKRRRR
jgi:hypothetical protein